MLKYTVGTLRIAGLDARWGKTRRGAPILCARNPNSKAAHQRNKWWAVDKVMWGLMQKHGVVDGFDGATILGEYFFI